MNKYFILVRSSYRVPKLSPNKLMQFYCQSVSVKYNLKIYKFNKLYQSCFKYYLFYRFIFQAFKINILCKHYERNTKITEL